MAVDDLTHSITLMEETNNIEGHIEQIVSYLGNKYGKIGHPARARKMRHARPQFSPFIEEEWKKKFFK